MDAGALWETTTAATDVDATAGTAATTSAQNSEEIDDVEAAEAMADEEWTPPTVAAAGKGSLTRREKGATSVPITKGPPARASSRKPAEIRSMISRYRDGLKGSMPAAEPNANTNGVAADDSIASDDITDDVASDDIQEEEA